MPPRFEHPLPAQFGQAIRVRGLARVGEVAAGQPLRYKLFWRASAAPGASVMLFAHLIGGDGQTYARADLPVETDAWQQRRYYTTELRIPLPADLPGSCYQLTIGIYDPASGARLPLSTALTTDPALDGPNALQLDRVCVG